MKTVHIGWYSGTVYDQEVETKDIPECSYAITFLNEIDPKEIERYRLRARLNKPVQCRGCVVCALAMEAAMKAKEMEEKANADKV